MACVIRDAGYDKIIVVTAIGKWMGSITPRLVKEIKQIGGPDLNRLVASDGDDNMMVDHSFILIGRRGLCRYNGVFRVKNYDISAEMRKFFPDLSSDPNDCYFENVNFENEKNKHSENQFFHLVDLRLTLNLSNDNRFSYLAPTITSVSPNKGPLTGNQEVRIRGTNFGIDVLAIKEILINGVLCKDIKLISSSLVTCVTRASTIMGPGVGNVIIRLLCGLSSPSNTCNMYEYAKMAEIEVDPIVPVVPVTPIIPIIPTIPLVPCHHPAIIVHSPKQVIHSRLFPRPMSTPLYAFKQKNTEDENGNPDMSQIMNNLDNRLYNGVNTKGVKKIDNLVTDNFKAMLNHAKTNGFHKSNDGFRKRRFQKIVDQIQS